MKKAVLKFKTIILSDVHLGAPDCQVDKVNYFLKHTRCEKLILNGDIIDGWSLTRRGGWNKKHTRFIRLVLKKMERRNTEVIYLRGNHDDVLDRFLPLNFDKLTITNEHIHQTPHRRYLITHGDLFDSVTQNSKIIAVVGDIGYQGLMKFNRVYNKYRAWRGKEYFSLSKAIKAKTKSVVNYISRFEDHVEAYTQKCGCDGFICGHIHTPADKMMGKIHYLNSGDWVESSTALVEDEDGVIRLLTYESFLQQIQAIEEQRLRERQQELQDDELPEDEEVDIDGEPLSRLEDSPGVETA